MGLTFYSPEWLWGLLLVPAFYVLHRRLAARKKRAALQFSSIRMLQEAAGGRSAPRTDLVLLVLKMALIALLVVALADPHLPLERTRKGVNVVLALDLSGSMSATDYKPSRLEAAKSAAERLLEGLQPNDNVGIVTFSDGATTASYLTPLRERTLENLRAIQPTQGRTALGDGLSLAVDMARSIPNMKRVVVLLTDGVNNAGVIAPDQAARFAKNNDIPVYTVGVGSKNAVLGYDIFGRPTYADLDEDTLKRVASETGGEYYRSVDSSTLSQIYAKLPEKIKREPEDTSIKDVFIVLAAVTLGGELYLRYGGRRILP